MLKTTVLNTGTGRVVIMDSITKVIPDDAGAHVVSASHGGVSSGEFALEVPLSSVFFNDAGVGKDGAGIAALAMLEARGVAAGTVSHESAKIGDSQDMWDHGVISHANKSAVERGLVPGLKLKDALSAAVGASAGR
jgi:hypothetical protein